MKLSIAAISAILPAFVAAVVVVPANDLVKRATANVNHDTYFANPNLSPYAVACSQPSFVSAYPHFSNIPGFPFLAGGIGASYGSAACGSCVQLSYTTPAGVTNVVYVTLVDSSSGFNVSPNAWNKLNTGNSATAPAADAPPLQGVTYAPAANAALCSGTQ